MQDFSPALENGIGHHYRRYHAQRLAYSTKITYLPVKDGAARNPTHFPQYRPF